MNTMNIPPCWRTGPSARARRGRAQTVVFASIALIDANTNLSVLAHGERVPKTQNATKAAFSSLFNNDLNAALVAFWVFGMR